MLREVHVEETAEGWGRRLAVIVMVTCVFDCVSILAGVIGARLDLAFQQADWLASSLAMFFGVCGTIALWRRTVRWRNQEGRNQPTWYGKRSTLFLWGADSMLISRKQCHFHNRVNTIPHQFQLLGTAR